MKFLWILVLVTGCEAHDMADQDRIRTYDPSPLFADGRSARMPVPGTVARGTLEDDIPDRLSREDLTRGQERFGIHCAPCHGLTGQGDGMVVQRGYLRPPDFHSAAMRARTVDYIYRVISGGFGAMPSYAEQVVPRDRWLIASYVKALQLSRTVPVDSLPEASRQNLPEGTP